MPKISIHPSLILLLLISLFGGFIKELCIFMVITFLHEMGHFISSKFYKINSTKITLTMLGGFIDLNNYQHLKTIPQLIINLSGIIVNLIIILLFIVIKNNFLDNNIIVIIINYNILMVIFNLLPIAPLDGYKILNTLFQMVFDEEYTKDCLYYLSLIFLVIISICLFIFKLYGYYLIVAFLFFRTIKEKRSSFKMLKQYSLFSKINY